MRSRGDEWLWRPSARDAAGAPLVCFPHAGASAAAFREWYEALAPGFEVWAALLPGRGARMAEPPARSTAELAGPIARAIAGQFEEPVTLFGHSFGGLLAFDVAHELVALGRAPRQVFVSATRAPSRIERTRVHALDEAGLRQWLVALGGVPDELLADPYLLDLILPVVRADTEACELYPAELATPLPAPITALVGTEDEFATVADVECWADYTTEAFHLAPIKGGHMFLTDDPAAVWDVVRGETA
ncbi:alpha/beta fold hydrolase [Streptomyces sp. SP17BM10]|uniref:thioesterase II family protein n=1 Tax=Streptomyces sp. SP17BM10 TaxID=3002530 RepID=UPI002E79D79F|nr:alpha/beta fold hydrolase [Streptomyces sp. SP17BM10]MEE1784675.1 alpha/beta fold hydrolase [Streptomyces sp. SP17BM10]